MQKEEIVGFLKERLSELLNVEVDTIDENKYLVEDFGVTSIMIVDLFVSVEEKYGVHMEDRLNLAESLTISQLADKVLVAVEEL